MSDSAPSHGDEDLVNTVYESHDERPEGESDIPWKPPVVSAVLGALAVAVFVIYAIVVGPTIDDAEYPGTASASSVADEPSDLLPPRFTPVTDNVGASVESMEPSAAGTVVAVATAVTGSAESAEVPPLDVAYWEIVTSLETTPMLQQYRWPELAGNDGGYVSVVFPEQVGGADGDLVSYVVGSVAMETSVLELSPELPVTVTDVRIDIGEGRSIVVEALTIARDGGRIEWRVEGGLTARVDAVVTLLASGGTNGTTLTMVPEYAPAYGFESSPGAQPVSMPYQFRSGYRLVLDLEGDPDPDLAVTGIVVEFRIAAVTAVEDPVTLPLIPGS